MLKWILGITLFLAITCIGSGYYLQTTGKLQEWREKYDPSAKPEKVRLSSVIKGDLVRTVSAPGQVEPKTKVEISAQVSARIIALPFREGDMVKANDVIVRLDGRDLAALLASAKAQLLSEEARLESAKAMLTSAQLDFARKKELFASKDIAPAVLEQTESEYKRAQSNLQVAERSIDIAKANIQRAEKDLENTVITAPFDGVITKLNAEVGELVVIGTLNNAGSVIMEVADLNVMLLKARIDEANIAPVHEGQKARIYVNAYPDLPFAGTISHIGLKREVDRDGTAYFETDILIDKPDNLMLRSGLTANADIQVQTFRDIVKVPSQAILDRSLDDLPPSVLLGSPVDRTKKFARVVYVITGGKAEPIVVKTGASDLTDTVVVAGLTGDERIVSGPFKTLETIKADQKVEEEVISKEHKDLADKSNKTPANKDLAKKEGEHKPETQTQPANSDAQKQPS